MNATWASPLATKMVVYGNVYGLYFTCNGGTTINETCGSSDHMLISNATFDMSQPMSWSDAANNLSGAYFNDVATHPDYCLHSVFDFLSV